MTEFKGYLDRLRENVEALDEAIATAKRMSKREDKSALQWTKTLRDLVELRNSTLERIKVHLLGRDETGAPTEPPDHYDGNELVEFERDFQNFLSPWTRKDLELECQDCHKFSEEVSQRRIITSYTSYGAPNYDDFDLCPDCYAKRKAAEPPYPKDGDGEE